MARYGYARVSTDDQDLTVQRAALKKADCNIILEEKVSGTTREGREKLELVIQLANNGDTIVCTRMDRLARSNKDFQNIQSELSKKGVSLEFTEQPIMNTGGALGGLMVDILAAFAQFETRLRAERQREGIKRAKDGKEVSPKTGRLKYGGREKTIDRKEVLQRRSNKEPISSIAREMGIARSSVYEILEEKVA